MPYLETFQQALGVIRARFPWLIVRELSEHPQVDALVELPVQAGLSLPIQLNLQNDELHLVASSLWVEWFPCTKAERVEGYVQAVTGLLSGELEIQETFILGRPVSAVLRRRGEPSECLARWSNLFALLPFPRTRRVVCNASAAA